MALMQIVRDKLNELEAPTAVFSQLESILSFDTEKDIQTKLNTFNDWKLVREFLDTKTKGFHAIGLSPSYMCELGNKITEFYKTQNEQPENHNHTLSPEYNS